MSMAGQIVSVEFRDPTDLPVECGLDGCECPDHETSRPEGVYITVRLDEEFAESPLGLWRVDVNRTAGGGVTN